MIKIIRTILVLFVATSVYVQSEDRPFGEARILPFANSDKENKAYVYATQGGPLSNIFGFYEELTGLPVGNPQFEVMQAMGLNFISTVFNFEAEVSVLDKVSVFYNSDKKFIEHYGTRYSDAEDENALSVMVYTLKFMAKELTNMLNANSGNLFENDDFLIQDLNQPREGESEQGAKDRKLLTMLLERKKLIHGAESRYYEEISGYQLKKFTGFIDKLFKKTLQNIESGTMAPEAIDHCSIAAQVFYAEFNKVKKREMSGVEVLDDSARKYNEMIGSIKSSLEKIIDGYDDSDVIEEKLQNFEKIKKMQNGFLDSIKSIHNAETEVDSQLVLNLNDDFVDRNTIAYMGEKIHVALAKNGSHAPKQAMNVIVKFSEGIAKDKWDSFARNALGILPTHVARVAIGGAIDYSENIPIWAKKIKSFVLDISGEEIDFSIDATPKSEQASVENIIADIKSFKLAPDVINVRDSVSNNFASKIIEGLPYANYKNSTFKKVSLAKSKSTIILGNLDYKIDLNHKPLPAIPSKEENSHQNGSESLVIKAKSIDDNFGLILPFDRSLNLEIDIENANSDLIVKKLQELISKSFDAAKKNGTPVRSHTMRITYKTNPPDNFEEIINKNDDEEGYDGYYQGEVLERLDFGEIFQKTKVPQIHYPKSESDYSGERNFKPKPDQTDKTAKDLEITEETKLKDGKLNVVINCNFSSYFS